MFILSNSPNSATLRGAKQKTPPPETLSFDRAAKRSTLTSLRERTATQRRRPRIPSLSNNVNQQNPPRREAASKPRSTGTGVASTPEERGRTVKIGLGPPPCPGADEMNFRRSFTRGSKQPERAQFSQHRRRNCLIAADFPPTRSGGASRPGSDSATLGTAATATTASSTRSLSTSIRQWPRPFSSRSARLRCHQLPDPDLATDHPI